MKKNSKFPDGTMIDQWFSDLPYINPWSQFFDLQGRKDLPISLCEHVTIKNCHFNCDTFFNVKDDPRHYRLSDFSFESLELCAFNQEINSAIIDGLKTDNLRFINKEKIDYPDSITTLSDGNEILH